MLNSYFKIAFRNLRRQRAYTCVNVFGLALSMSVCLLIILLIQDQMSYDRFHARADRIYRVIADQHERDGDVETVAATPAFLGPALKRDVPGMRETVRLAQLRTNAIHDGTSVSVRGIYAESSFFDVFSFELLAGDPAEALVGPAKVLLSEETARRIFGETNPVGQILALEGAGEFTVSGIVATKGIKSHLQFDVLASFATVETLSYGRERLEQEVSFWWFATYLLLDEGAGTEGLERYLAQVSERYENRQDADRYVLRLQPLTGITLGPMLGNEIASFVLPLFVVLLLGGIGAVVMLAAGFNYIGLTVARSLQRAREVGVRKTVGALRRQLIQQFLAESVLLAIAALILANLLLIWVVPGFNSLTVIQEFDIRLNTEAVYSPHVAGAFLGFTLLVGLLAGWFPAFYLSKFDPVLVLKGAGLGRGHGRLRLRKVLVTTQLVFALVFLISGVLIYRQLDFMITFDYGFRTADIINMDLQGNAYATLRHELLRHPGVQNVAATSVPPASGATMATDLAADGSDTLTAVYYSVDAQYLSTLDLNLLAGNNFSPDRGAEGLIISATTTRRLGFGSPDAAVGQDLYFGGVSGPVPVIGVVEDYQYHILIRGIGPMLLYHDPEMFNTAMIRIHPDEAEEVVAHLEAVWKSIDPVHPVAYTFYDRQLRYDDEGAQVFRDLVDVVGLATFIALIIACLGLLAMVTFNAELRTKEVGIRKVLGATIPGVTWLLSREFLLLIPVALVLAIPLAYVGNNLWLEQIANRVAFGPGVFIVGTALLVTLAVLAIATQAIRTALADPVDSLRYE